MRKLALAAGAALILIGNVGTADAQWRRGWGHGGFYGYRHGGWGGGGALAAGLIGGALLGGIAAAAAPAYAYPGYYGYGGYYGYPAYGGYYPAYRTSYRAAYYGYAPRYSYYGYAPGYPGYYDYGSAPFTHRPHPIYDAATGYTPAYGYPAYRRY